jgi:predicted permease
MLVQAQVGLSVLLLVGTVLVSRSFGALTGVDPGFEATGVLSLELVLPPERHGSPEAVGRFHTSLTDQARAIPGVVAATTVNYLPLNHEYATTRVRVAGVESADATAATEATYLRIGPDYFRVMGIPVHQGREFTRDDGAGQRRVAVVNASFARRYWPDGSAIGSVVRIGRTETPYTVVGVAGDSRQVDLAEADREQVFLPMMQQPQTYFRLLARTTGDPRALVSPLTAAVHAVDPLLPVVDVRTLEQVVDDALLPQRSLSLALVIMGGFSLALALLGIYGIVMVYVVDRTREMGIRIALGADERRIARFVLARGLRLAGIGAAIGLVVAFAASLAARGLLYGVEAIDPMTYAIVVVLVIGIAALAGALPARRAARTDALTAIRS